MLMANQTVARHIQNLRQQTGRKVPFIYRIHEPPGKKSIEEFTIFVKSLGYGFDPGKRVTPTKFQALLKSVKGTLHEFLIEEVMLRAMMKAIYSTRNAGHFGLAFGPYTHFTSPIRRYPDLAVHRLLKTYATIENGVPSLPYQLSHVCEMSTDREIRAQEAERESIRALQVAFIEKRIGQEYDGIISGVTAFGFFVEIPEYLIEGLIPLRDLRDDYYLLDERHHTLIGQHTGRRFRLGDPVRIRVARVHHELRKIDFTLVD
jgi:ribonuclease R